MTRDEHRKNHDAQLYFLAGWIGGSAFLFAMLWNHRTVSKMTRDEHRAACIEAMEMAGNRRIAEGEADLRAILTAALDSLPTAGARVVPIEATDEMLEATFGLDDCTPAGEFLAMSSAGDLTNPPETKPWRKLKYHSHRTTSSASYMNGSAQILARKLIL